MENENLEGLDLRAQIERLNKIKEEIESSGKDVNFEGVDLQPLNAPESLPKDINDMNLNLEGVDLSALNFPKSIGGDLNLEGISQISDLTAQIERLNKMKEELESSEKENEGKTR